ncbi:MAG: hypothetical protein WCI04_05850 [archaeon]
MTFERTSTILLHKAKGKMYFRTGVPFDIATQMLGLSRDVKRQELIWRIENNKVIVEKK